MRTSVPAQPRMTWRTAMWSAIALVLCAPVVAMKFTREVNWGIEDFAFAALLLGAAGATMELVYRKARARHAVAIVGVAVASLVLVIWADAAVGIF